MRPRWLTRSPRGMLRNPAKVETDLAMLRLLSEGLTYDEVAAALGVTATRCRTTVHRLCERADARTLPALVRVATEEGLFEGEAA